MKRQKAKNNDERRLLAKDSDESAEETELFVRKTAFKEIETVEKVVEEGDTLQALSIRYHCTIAELKRLNNIHRDNEIFAKRAIKVPARAFTMALVHISGNSSPHINQKSEQIEIDSHQLEMKLKSSMLNASINSNDLNSLIFNSIMTSKPCDSSDDLIEEVHDEEINLLPKESVEALTPVVTKISWNGADADISWIALIVCIVIVVFAVPLVYVFYIAEHPDQYHHRHEHS